MKNKLGKLLFRKIFIWYIIVAVLLTMLQIYSEYSTHKNNLLLSLQNTQKVLKDAVSSAIWYLDEDQIKYNVQAMRSMDSVLGVLIVDPDNSVISQSGILDKGAQGYSDYLYKKEKVVYQDNLIKHSFALINKELSPETLGTVTLYSDKDLIYNAMKDHVLLIVINSLLKSFILMLLFLYFINKIVSQSLNTLTQAIRKTSINSDEKKIDMEELDIVGDHEISVLVDSYNKMQNRIHNERDKNRRLSERIELALIGTHDGMWDWNILDNSVYFSSRWKEMLGYRDDELANELSSWADRVHPDDVDEAWADIDKNINGETEYYENIHRLKHKDGHWVWILDRGKTQYDASGKAVRMIGTHTDITDEKEMQLKFAEQTRMLEESQRLVHIGSWKFNHLSDVLSWSNEIYRVFEVECVFLPTYDLIFQVIHPDDRQEVDAMYRNSLKDQEPYMIVYRIIMKDGRIKFVREQCETIFDHAGSPLTSLGTIQDITEQKILEDKLYEQKEMLEHMAHHDALTQLPNRMLFNDRLEQGIAKAKRHQGKLAILFIDLDRFKEINDSLGHEVGDSVLKVAANRIQAVIRDEDTLARLGGDEFMIIMEELKKPQDASLLAQKVLEVLIKPIYIKGHSLYVSGSIGISLYPQDDVNINNLIKYADAAMYKAKHEGRNNFQFYSSEMSGTVSKSADK